MINFNAISKFNFTYAMTGGAWLEDSTGNRNWFSIETITEKLGEGWFLKQIRKQGFFTGCWITVEG